MTEQPLILVVDDETHILHVVSLKLRNAGYRVITAGDGEAGLAAVLEHRPALVITDYQMPFMTGQEMCQAMADHPEASAIPAIMLTARGYSMSHDGPSPTNILGVLSKPFSPREVLSKVQQCLARETPPTSTPVATSEKTGAVHA